jgi:hypothetical protein
MKFKAKPKLTPERLRRKIKLKNVRFTGANLPRICWAKEDISYLISSINEIVGGNNNPKPEIDYHCDADFY